MWIVHAQDPGRSLSTRCDSPLPRRPPSAAGLMDGLLTMLSEAEGDLTENEGLINSLEESKRLADEISTKVGGKLGGKEPQVGGWAARGG